MLCDDDIIITPEKLNKMFELLVEKDLWIVSPAFSKLGKISHDTTERNLTTDYRYTNFAEVTCPIFRSDKLKSFMDIYDEVLPCFGVNWWYLNHLGKSKDKIVISDQCYCVNPRDFKKSGSKREIDKFISKKQRESAWAEFKKKNNIQTFPKEIYGKKRSSYTAILKRLPSYIFESMTYFLLESKHLIKLRILIKKIKNQ